MTLIRLRRRGSPEILQYLNPDHVASVGMHPMGATMVTTMGIIVVDDNPDRAQFITAQAADAHDKTYSLNIISIHPFPHVLAVEEAVTRAGQQPTPGTSEQTQEQAAEAPPPPVRQPSPLYGPDRRCPGDGQPGQRRRDGFPYG